MKEEKKSRRIEIRVSEEEYARIKYNADKYQEGNIGELLRQLAVYGQITVVQKPAKSNPKQAAVYDLIKEYRKVGTNYNQVVKSVHQMAGGRQMPELVAKNLERLAEHTDQLIALTKGVQTLFEDGDQDNQVHPD
ncbi:hypothetical protein HDR62_03365 [bacterium]|nr:hypothetical protein [bacterium]